MPASRRGARVDDWGGLENRCSLAATEGSNPSLSAEYFIPPPEKSTICFNISKILEAFTALVTWHEGENTSNHPNTKCSIYSYCTCKVIN